MDFVFDQYVAESYNRRKKSRNSKDTKTHTHVLGYRIQNVEMMEQFVHPLLEARNQNTLRQVEILRENGFSIAPTSSARLTASNFYKQHVMEYLVETGQVLNIIRFLCRKSKIFVPSLPSSK